jgi:hypothetical protein
MGEFYRYADCAWQAKEVNANPVGAYGLNLATVAKRLDKTPAQLAAALNWIVDDGLIAIGEPIKPGAPLSAKQCLAPTLRR